MSGARGDEDPGADAELERLRAALYAPDAAPEAAERYRAALARATPAGAGAADGADPSNGLSDAPSIERHTRRGIRTALTAGALLVAAGVGAVLLVPRPAADLADRPPRIGRAIWSAHGLNGASSPNLDGRGGPLLVRLRCQGDGRVLLAVDSRVRILSCVAGKALEDDQYFDGPHDQFQLSLSLVDHPTWTVSVHRVLPAAGG